MLCFIDYAKAFDYVKIKLTVQSATKGDLAHTVSLVELLHEHSFIAKNQCQQLTFCR